MLLQQPSTATAAVHAAAGLMRILLLLLPGTCMLLQPT
jgi:hypothetical protein